MFTKNKHLQCQKEIKNKEKARRKAGIQIALTHCLTR